MKITHFADYGLRALIMLASRSPDVLSAAAIADYFGVSRHHMAKVLQSLATAGYVEALRGVQGGARLARDPRDIRIGDLVRTLEGNQPLIECFRAEGCNCRILPHCEFKAMLEHARNGFLRELDRYTLDDCLKGHSLGRMSDELPTPSH